VKSALVVTVAMLALAAVAYPGLMHDADAGVVRNIVTSDTILSTMIDSLLPPARYSVASILPPGQCPGQFDVKLSDIERMKKADLIVAFVGMPYIEKGGSGKQLLVETGGRNWMSPDSYLSGLDFLASRLSERFPEEREEIVRRKAETAGRVEAASKSLREKIDLAGLAGKPVIVTSAQKEPAEWMGFRVVAEYGRPESMSAREIVTISTIGRERRAILVIDNLQSGPDAGKGIAEALGAPHVVLTNFPSEEGYLATLEENVNAVLTALRK